MRIGMIVHFWWSRVENTFRLLHIKTIFIYLWPSYSYITGNIGTIDGINLA